MLVTSLVASLVTSLTRVGGGEEVESSLENTPKFLTIKTLNFLLFWGELEEM